MAIDDRELAHRFSSGDDESVRAVYQRYGRAVHTVAYSIVRDTATAADVVQATFVKAWQAAGTFNPERDLGPWLYTIARRQAIDTLRRERRIEPAETEVVDSVEPPPSLESTWEAFQVRLAVDQLPEDEREVVRLAWFLGLSHPEISERLAVPIGTVKSRSHRAHRRLTSLLAHVVAENRSDSVDVEVDEVARTARGVPLRATKGRRTMTDEEPNGRIEDPDDERAVAALLDALAPALRDEAVWVEPPAGLADSIIAAIASERTAGPAAPLTAVPTAPPMSVPDAPENVRPITSARSRRSRATWWVGAAAAAAVAALAVGIVVSRGDGESDQEQFAIEGTELAPAAVATAEVNERGAGVAIALDIHDLPPAPEGFYYQGWVRDEDGETVTIGTFHMRSGDSTVTLWSGVPVEEYPTLTITLQEEGAGPESSGQVVLRGSIVP